MLPEDPDLLSGVDNFCRRDRQYRRLFLDREAPEERVRRENGLQPFHAVVCGSVCGLGARIRA